MVDPVGELHHVGHDEETEAEAGDDHQHQDMLQTSPGSCSHVTKVDWSLYLASDLW